MPLDDHCVAVLSPMVRLRKVFIETLSQFNVMLGLIRIR